MSRDPRRDARWAIAATLVAIAASGPQAALHAQPAPAAPVQEAPADPAAALVAEGGAALRRQDYPAAIAAYERAIAANPRSTAAHKQLVWTTFIGHTKIDGADVDATGRTEALTRLRDRYSKAVADDPSNPVLHWALGQVVQHTDGYAAAEPHHLAAVARDPSFAEAYQDLALIAEFRGDLVKEREYLKKRVEIEPGNADAFFYYAMSIQGRKDPAEFRRLAFEVARRFPDSPRGPAALSFYAGKAPTPEDAIGALEELRRLFPDAERTSGAMHTLFWLYAEASPEKALALGRDMQARLKDAGENLRKTWQTNVALVEAVQQARAALAADGQAAHALTALKAAARPRFVDLAFVDVVTAKLQHRAGETAQAYDVMVARQALEPRPAFLATAEDLGRALDKPAGQIHDDVRAARMANAKPAPAFALHAYRTGKDVSLADYRGRVVLVDFWYPACGPCRGEFPYLQRAAEKYEDRGFVVLALNGHPEEDAFVLPFLDGNAYDFVPLRATEEVVKAYGVRGYPANFLVDREGRIVFTPDQVASESRLRDLEAQIEALLDEPASGPATAEAHR